MSLSKLINMPGAVKFKFMFERMTQAVVSRTCQCAGKA